MIDLLATQARKYKTNGDWCLATVLKAMVELREASLQVLEAVARFVWCVWRLQRPSYYLGPLLPMAHHRSSDITFPPEVAKQKMPAVKSRSTDGVLFEESGLNHQLP